MCAFLPPRASLTARAAVLLGMLGVVGCTEEAPPAATPPPPPVRVGRVESVMQTPSSAGTAEIRGQRTATLRAEVPGRVVALLVERGQRVGLNDVLARLDTGRTAAAVGAADAGIAQAEANLAQATRERDLAERLAAQGSVATQQLDRARDAAKGMDVRIGGGANTIQQYLRAGLIDELHFAISPVLLGSGERLFEGVDLRALGFECVQFVASEKATHVVLRRQGHNGA